MKLALAGTSLNFKTLGLPIDFAMQQGNNTTDPGLDFGEFAPATYAEWREAAVAALKGADFDKKLLTKLVE